MIRTTEPWRRIRILVIRESQDIIGVHRWISPHLERLFDVRNAIGAVAAAANGFLPFAPGRHDAI